MTAQTAKAPVIFLDTNILKAAVDSRRVFIPESKTVNWGGRDITRTVHRPALYNQNTKYQANNPTLFANTLLIRFIAALAREAKVRLIIQREVALEWMGVKGARGAGGKFHGATIEFVPGPISYGRVAFDSSGRDNQYEFLCSLEDKRFRQFQRWCGAWQGPGRPRNRNQLLDAFHLWCAESAGAEYFLTHDNALSGAMAQGKSSRTAVKLVTAGELCRDLLDKHPNWYWALLKELFRLRVSGRQLCKAYQDASRDYWTRQ